MAFPFIMRIIKLKENRDFRRAYNRGKAFVTPALVLYVNKSRRQGVRLGITAGKKIGKAVKRNRAKRVITAAFRELLPRIADGYDFVIVARTKILNLKSTDVLKLLNKALLAAGALKENNETTADISD